MKRVLINLTVLLVVFVIFALVVGQLRDKPVDLRIPFFPTVRLSVEALAYASFFIGLLLAGVMAMAGDLALRRRFRTMLLEQRRHAEEEERAAATGSGEETRSQ